MSHPPTEPAASPYGEPPHGEPPYGEPVTPAKSGSNTMIIVSVVLGVVALVALLLCAGAIALLYPAVSAARTAAQRMESQNNLKQIGLALHNYHDVHGQFPAPAIFSDDGTPLLSWRVVVLPYLENGQELYDRFELTESWNSPHNLPLIDEMPDAFRSPLLDLPEGQTVYLAISDDEAVFTSSQPVSIADIADGAANTAMVLEVRNGIPWSAPQDITLERAAAEMALGGPRGVLLADGSVHAFGPGEIDADKARAMCTRAGGD